MKMEHPFKTFCFCPRCGSSTFMVHDEKSKECRHCGFVYYFNPSAATAAFVQNEYGELLVCRRARNPAEGTWDLPGGFCDCYESGEACVAREIREETGLVITDFRYLFSLPNRYPYSGFTVHTVDLFFSCFASKSALLFPKDDVATCFWVPLSALKPEYFGLTSIRETVTKVLMENLLKKSNIKKTSI